MHFYQKPAINFSHYSYIYFVQERKRKYISGSLKTLFLFSAYLLPVEELCYVRCHSMQKPKMQNSKL